MDLVKSISALVKPPKGKATDGFSAVRSRLQQSDKIHAAGKRPPVDVVEEPVAATRAVIRKPAKISLEIRIKRLTGDGFRKLRAAQLAGLVAQENLKTAFDIDL